MASLVVRTNKPKTYPITGIKAGIKPGDDAVPLRLEVDSWYPPPSDNPTYLRQVTLFIWALRFFQGMDPDEKLSYFQVAGQPYYSLFVPISQS